MRFVQFLRNGKQFLGVEKTIGGAIVDLSASGKEIPTKMIDFLKEGQKTWDAAASIVQGGQHMLPSADVSLLSPVTTPDKVLCVGLNYKDHCEELNVPLPTEPVIFNKFPSTLVGTNCNLAIPPVTKALDWEVELAAVIGKKGRNIEKTKAMDYIFGYCVALDVSARDLLTKEFNCGQWLIGKSMDNFCPLGPAIVTSEEIKDPHNLSIKCSVNGVTKQSSNTNQLVHRLDTLVEYLSRFFTLLPGDIILTGTPPGVGAVRTPPEFLKKGDVIECEVEKIGRLLVNVE